MAKFILSEVKDFVNRKDLVTNFSPFHYALFSENLEMMDLLIRYPIVSPLSSSTSPYSY